MKVAINGFGRIGRLVFRIMEEDNDIEVVAVNDLTDAEQLSYLLKYDSSQGGYRRNDISFLDDNIIVGDRKIKVYSEMDPVNLPWGDLDIDVVFECSGHFTTEEGAHKHIEAGAKGVVVGAPCKGNVKTVVFGVNEDILDGTEEIISSASCTTNCIAPMLKVIDDNFTVKKGYMTTVHAYTNDQVLLDVAHKKGISSRRGRAGCLNIIPTSTGAASAIGKVIPSLDGRLKGTALRVPVGDGSCVELLLQLEKNVSKEEINDLFIKSVSDAMDATYDPIVSSDIIGSTFGGVVDLALTDIVETSDSDGQLVKIVGWYDNEFGYSNQMVRVAKHFCNLK